MPRFSLHSQPCLRCYLLPRDSRRQRELISIHWLECLSPSWFFLFSPLVPFRWNVQAPMREWRLQNNLFLFPSACPFSFLSLAFQCSAVAAVQEDRLRFPFGRWFYVTLNTDRNRSLLQGFSGSSIGHTNAREARRLRDRTQPRIQRTWFVELVTLLHLIYSLSIFYLILIVAFYFSIHATWRWTSDF